MRIVLNAGSVSDTAMSGIGHYTDALVRAVLRCRTDEGLTLLTASRSFAPLLSDAHADRVPSPNGSAEL